MKRLPVKCDGVKMTIVDLAKVLNVTTRTITRYVTKLYPEELHHGSTTFLDETQVTAIKLDLEKNKHLDTSVTLPKTELEEDLLIQQAQNLLLNRVNKLQDKVKSQALQLEEQKPKVEFYEDLINSDGLYSGSDAARMLGTGRQRLFDRLRADGIFLKYSALPNHYYSESDYFVVKPTVTRSGHSQKQTFITPKGLEWLKKKYYSEVFQKSF